MMTRKNLFSFLALAGMLVAGTASCGTTVTSSSVHASSAASSAVSSAQASSSSKVVSSSVAPSSVASSSETKSSSASSTQSSVSSIVSSEVTIDIPFAAEADLAEKTLSYWSGTGVAVTKAKKGTADFAFAYTSSGVNWLGMQVLYKNSELVSGNAYKVDFTLNSSVAGKITVNGKAVDIAIGDNTISQKYVCGTDTGVTTALSLIMGNADDGLIAAADFTITMPTWTETDLHTYSNADWKNVMQNPSTPGTGKEYYFDNYADKGEIVESGNDTERSNGLVKTNTTVDDYYTVSFDAQGEQAYPVTARTQVGIVPWYVDDSNWIIFYIDYNPDVRPSSLWEFNITGYVNGNHVGWNDFWGDQSPYSTYASAPNVKNSFKVSVAKITTKTGIARTFTAYFNNQLVGSRTFTSIADPATYGMCIRGDVVTVSNIAYQKDTEPERSYTVVKQGATAPTWKVNTDKSVTVTAGTSSDGFLADFIAYDDPMASGDYTITSTITGTAAYPVTAEIQEGFLCWYKDDANYVVAYLRWAPDAGFESTIRELQITGFINGSHVGWNSRWPDQYIVPADAQYAPNAAIKFTMIKVGSTFQGVINGTTMGDPVDFSTYDANKTIDWTALSKVGYYDHITTATFSAMTVGTVGRTYSVLNKGTDVPVWKENDDKTASLKAGSATDGFLGDFVAFSDDNAKGDYTISSTITGTGTYPLTAEIQEGFLCWYKDSSNYLVAYIRWAPDTGYESAVRNMEITGNINGTSVGWHDFWVSTGGTDAQYAPNQPVTFAVKKVGSTFQPTINGNAFGDAVDFASYDTTSAITWADAVKVGYYVHITTAVFSPMTVTAAA
jgi:hypothetical protein